MAQRSKEEVLEYLGRAEVAAVGTSDMGTPRQRMMHFGTDENFNMYVSSMKGDPKILQGEKPSIFEFPENRLAFDAWDDVKAKARAWKEAIRPLSLTASLIPLLLGGAVAFSVLHAINLSLFLLTLLGGIMIQAGTNMINDWKDAERDNENVEGIRPFTGGSRMIQLGLISRSDMGFFGILVSAVAALIGIYLVFVSGWGLIPLIIYGLLAGMFYTGAKGKFSFINMAPGLAEFLIATTYGVLMTMGAFYVQTGYFSLQIFLLSLPVAIFITNVLLVNQFQDADSDQKTGKNTLVVRMGKKRSKNILIGFFIAAYAIIALLPVLGFAPYALYFAFLSIPFAVQAIRYTQHNYNKAAVDLISGNAHTAIAHLFAGLLLVFAFILSGTGYVLPVLYLVASVLLVAWVWNYIERKRKTMNSFRLAIKKG